MKYAAPETKRYAQNPPAVCEFLLYAILPFLLIMAGAMPSAAIVVLPFALCLLFLLYRRWGIYLPLCCIAVYGAASLLLNYDILTAIYFVTLFCAFCGLLLSQQTTPYLQRFAFAVIPAAAGMLIGVGIVFGAETGTVRDIAARYVTANGGDPVISFFARAYYNSAELAPGAVRLAPSDPGYFAAAIERFSTYVGDTLFTDFWYLCIHCGFLLGAIGFVVADIVNRRTFCYADIGENSDTVKRDCTLALGAVVKERRLSQMRLPRSFLWTMALPVTVAGIILGFVWSLDMLTATLMHMFVTLPAAFFCYCLLAYFAELFKGKARVAAFAVWGIIGIVAVIFPIALFILSAVGVCDCILNLRFWTEFIRSD